MIRGRRDARRGVTLVELVVAMVIMTVTVMAGVASFKYITKGIRGTRTRTIAVNLAQEKMETLKNVNYFQLQVTTNSASDANFTPNLVYDPNNNVPETVSLYGLPAMTRRVFVAYAAMSGVGISTVSPSTGDTGLKQVVVYVSWKEDAGDYKKVEIRNLFANPSAKGLNATISGTVTISGGVTGLGNAKVEVVGYPNWKGTTASDGTYSFEVSKGTYSVRCSSASYYTSVSSARSVTQAENEIVDFSMIKIASGSVVSTVWISSNILISQVVASSGVAGPLAQEQEYIELYNPTTYAWILNDAGVAQYQLVYDDDDTVLPAETALALTFVNATSTIGPKNYFLIASQPTVSVDPLPVDASVTRVADAYYNCGGMPAFTACPNVIADNTRGALGLRRVGTLAQWTDRVAWQTMGPASFPPATLTEAFPALPIGIGGLDEGEALVRKNSTDTAVFSTLGNSYDSNSNNLDLLMFTAITSGFEPRTTGTGALPSISGAPAYAAFASANDGLSVSTKAVNKLGTTNLSPYAEFTILGVATGTWKVTITSGPYLRELTIVGSTQGVTNYVPNQTTSSSWPVTGYSASILASTTSGGIVEGYVYGSGTEYNTPLAGILVEGNGATTRTGTNGYYAFSTTTGAVTVNANFNTDDKDYLSASADGTVLSGESVYIAASPYFHLSKGGTLRGFVTSGSGALPNVTVKATLGGATYTSVSDPTGYFYIAVSTSGSAYTVEPELDPTQSFTTNPSPLSPTTVSLPGSTVFVGTITIAGGTGSITGSVKDGADPITTGVLVIASLGAVADPPPAIYGSTAAALTNAFYSISSKSDGSYNLSVPTGTFNMRAYYPVVNTVGRTVSYQTCAKTIPSPVTAGGATIVQDFKWGASGNCP